MSAPTPFGAPELRLPDNIREPLKAHIAELHGHFLKRGWGGKVGFGKKPALIVIDLAIFWTKPTTQVGSDLESVIQNSLTVLAAAREAKIPIFFTSYALDPSDPPSPQNKKLRMSSAAASDPAMFELDPRLERRPNEKLIRKRYASAFKGTNFHEMLASLGIDTLIVTGVSTSHCVYATCRDATDSVRVIVPREAVGERCELLHEVNMLDIELDLGDVMPVSEILEHLRKHSG